MELPVKLESLTSLDHAKTRRADVTKATQMTTSWTPEYHLLVVFLSGAILEENVVLVKSFLQNPRVSQKEVDKVVGFKHAGLFVLGDLFDLKHFDWNMDKDGSHVFPPVRK